MEESDAYTFIEKECENPVFKNIDATFILTLENSNRIKNLDEYVFTLSKKTFVQFNKGFKNFKKKNVDTTCKDILHACRNIFFNSQNYGNILVLEDDAKLISKNYKETTKSLKCVDYFIGSNRFNVYSLGSLGFTVPTSDIFHQKFLGFMGFAQAIIYSKNVRRQLLDTDIRKINHIDANFLSKINMKFTYYKPIIVQHFQNTENMNEWGINKKKGTCEIIGTKLFIYFIQKILRLEHSLKGWYVFYFINNTPLILGSYTWILFSYLRNINRQRPK